MDSPDCLSPVLWVNGDLCLSLGDAILQSANWRLKNSYPASLILSNKGKIRMLASVLQILFSIFALVFDFWWAFLLLSLLNRRRGIRNTIYVWGLWAIIRLILFFNPEPIARSLLIPEPLNTILFFVIGFILITILIGATYWRRIQTRSKAFSISSEGLLNLSPGDFEEMVAELYRAMGHQASRTGSIGDHGVDVVVNAKNGEKWVVQCKRWRTPAGESIVRDFYGMMQHEKAAQGAIIATSGFSQPAIEWAKGKPLYLYNGKDFLGLWEKVKKQQLQQTKRA
jgi:hypothetical protein